jgi:hypothetical protein
MRPNFSPVLTNLGRNQQSTLGYSLFFKIKTCISSVFPPINRTRKLDLVLKNQEPGSSSNYKNENWFLFGSCELNQTGGSNPPKWVYLDQCGVGTYSFFFYNSWVWVFEKSKIQKNCPGPVLLLLRDLKNCPGLGLRNPKRDDCEVGSLVDHSCA